MTDFRDVLRAELVAAAERPVPRRTLPSRPVLFRSTGLAVAAAAAALAIFVLPWGADHAPSPPLTQSTLPGQPLFGGSLERGVRYRTRALSPPISFRALGPAWFVYDGTSNTTLVLQRREGSSAKGTERPPRLFLMFLRLPDILDPGTGDVRPAPDDLVAALRANPDLGVTAATRTQLFGHPATRLSFHVPTHPAHVQPTCEYAKVTVDTEPPAVATCMAIAPNVALPADSAGYLIVPDGADPLIVAQVTLVPSRLGQIVRESQPVLQSVLLGR